MPQRTHLQLDDWIKDPIGTFNRLSSMASQQEKSVATLTTTNGQTIQFTREEWSAICNAVENQVDRHMETAERADLTTVLRQFNRGQGIRVRGILEKLLKV